MISLRISAPSAMPLLLCAILLSYMVQTCNTSRADGNSEIVKVCQVKKKGNWLMNTFVGAKLSYKSLERHESKL